MLSFFSTILLLFMSNYISQSVYFCISRSLYEYSRMSPYVGAMACTHRETGSWRDDTNPEKRFVSCRVCVLSRSLDAF